MSTSMVPVDYTEMVRRADRARFLAAGGVPTIRITATERDAIQEWMGRDTQMILGIRVAVDGDRTPEEAAAIKANGFLGLL